MKPHTFFISDLHLCAQQPHTVQLFRHFVQHTAPGAEALYILGDLFESWAGDDDLDAPFHLEITRALHSLAATGMRVYIMHGNRDFLMAEKLANVCGAELLPDPSLIDLYGIPTLLTHGDTLCTDDTAYQIFRQQVRDDVWQLQFLTQPLEQRKQQIAQLRARSENEKQQKCMGIMDVNADAVAELLRKHGYPRLIHGHTHRPGRTRYHLEGHNCERWVLGDWHASASVLRCDEQGCALG